MWSVDRRTISMGSRKGFYLYDEKRKARSDPKIKTFIGKAREISGVNFDLKIQHLALILQEMECRRTGWLTLLSIEIPGCFLLPSILALDLVLAKLTEKEAKREGGGRAECGGGGGRTWCRSRGLMRGGNSDEHHHYANEESDSHGLHL